MGKHKVRRAPESRSGGRGQAARGGAARYWLYGAHAVLAALANPRRQSRRLLVTAEAERRLAAALAESRADRPGAPAPQRRERREIEALLPEGAVHQGLALEVEPLGSPDLAAILASGADSAPGAPAVVVALDQVTDPQNTGAILRSAAAFGALAVIAPTRHAAPESGALAKIASGALERVPYCLVSNLARALDQAAEAGFFRFGLDAQAETGLARADRVARAVLVLGAEGSGLRRLTRAHCDRLLRLPTAGDFAQLNVANAAAVALYELLGRASSDRA